MGEQKCLSSSHVSQLDGAPLRYGKVQVLNPYFVASSMPLPDSRKRG